MPCAAGKTSLIHFFIIHIGLAAAPVCILTFFFCQPSIFDQLFEIDQVGIARKGRKCLIGESPYPVGLRAGSATASVPLPSENPQKHRLLWKRLMPNRDGRLVTGNKTPLLLILFPSHPLNDMFCHAMQGERSEPPCKHSRSSDVSPFLSFEISDFS